MESAVIGSFKWNPVVFSLTNSVIPPRVLTKTGLPAPIASIATMQNGSWNWEGMTTKSASG